MAAWHRGIENPEPSESVTRRTQRKLGELAGVGTRFVSDLERGKPTLRMDAVNKVLYVFGRMLGYVEAPRTEDDNENP